MVYVEFKCKKCGAVKRIMPKDYKNRADMGNIPLDALDALLDDCDECGEEADELYIFNGIYVVGG